MNGKNKFISFIKLYFFKIFLIIIIVLSFELNKIINYYTYNIDNFYKNSLNIKINIGIVSKSIKNGGIERAAALILYYFNKVKIFKLFLFTLFGKQDNEYFIDNNIERITFKNNLIGLIVQKKIDILIYQLYNYKEINELNKIKNLKVVLINNSCFLFWIYSNGFYYFKTYYEAYKNSQYTISLVPFENDYLFKKWGINSILIKNFIQYEYYDIVPSDLSSDIILMIGRGDDKFKRFDLGIKAMKFIVNDIPQSEMKLISNLNGLFFLKKLIKDLNIEKNIKFVGYTSNPSIYFKNASIHLFPTVCESFGNVLTETKIFGIPNILVGLDYVAASKGGTAIIYDDSPLSIAKVAIKILKNKKYKKKLGLAARNSMKKFNNILILKRWIKIILSIYNGKEDYEKLRNKDKKITDKEAINLIEKQINLLKYRNQKFMNLTLKDVENLTFMQNLK
jgi:hypothetical protein